MRHEKPGLTFDLPPVFLQLWPRNSRHSKSFLSVGILKILYMHMHHIFYTTLHLMNMSWVISTHHLKRLTFSNFSRGLFSVFCLLSGWHTAWNTNQWVCLTVPLLWRIHPFQTWYYLMRLKYLFIHLQYLCTHPSVFPSIHTSIYACGYKLQYSTQPLLTVTVKEWLPITPTVNTCQRQLAQSSLWHCWISDMKDGLDSPLWQPV